MSRVPESLDVGAAAALVVSLHEDPITPAHAEGALSVWRLLTGTTSTLDALAAALAAADVTPTLTAHVTPF